MKYIYRYISGYNNNNNKKLIALICILLNTNCCGLTLRHDFNIIYFFGLLYWGNTITLASAHVDSISFAWRGVCTSSPLTCFFRPKWSPYVKLVSVVISMTNWTKILSWLRDSGVRHHPGQHAFAYCLWLLLYAVEHNYHFYVASLWAHPSLV